MNCVFFKIKRALLVCLSFCFLIHSGYSIAEDICAEVKIEILQEFAIERQAFEGVMRINNKLDTVPLENVNIEVDFADENGIPVVKTYNQSDTSASFFITVSDMTGISDIGGNGTIAQSSVAEIRWLIIPTPLAVQGQPLGKLYYVGARLSYTYGGKSQTINVSPDTIVVKPQPEIQLDYFLTENIVGDNPHTSFVESPVPYSLGVRVRNSGFGVAKNVSIDSAQPKIVENDQGLAIGFSILESYIGNQVAEKTLLLKFGDIAPGASKVGRWVMETTLSGEFISFNATTTHAEELGGQLTSLIRETDEHFLEHDVYVDVPGRDDVTDFLVRANDLESVIYESESTGSALVAPLSCVDCVRVQNVNAGTFALPFSRLTITEDSLSGFVHIKVAASSALAQKLIKRVVRDDGRTLSSRNSWISQKRNPDDPANPFYYINLLDYYSSVHSGSMGYSIGYGDALENPQAPAIQAVLARTTYEGGQVGFLIVASDLDSPKLTLKVESLPVGASFKDQGANTGIFSWKPIVGQAGDYSITFKASDGALSDTLVVPIKVNPADDTDGDGLPDSWEMEHFNSLSESANGNPDLDSLSNLEEYRRGTDPTQYSQVIDAPNIVVPLYDQEVSLTALSLVVDNIASQSGSVPQYIFELYSDQSMANILLTESLVEQSDNGGTTVLPVQVTLSDNTEYFWRVRANVDDVYSVWQEGKFFTNSANEAPNPPVMAYPYEGSIVDTKVPEFYVSNSFDVDRDAVTYNFILATETLPETVIASVDGLSAGQSGTTRWAPLTDESFELSDDTAYVWRVTAIDEHGLSSSQSEAHFFVSTANDAPSIPTNLQPPAGAVISTSDAVLTANASTDVEGSSLSYEFQLDTVPTFDSVNYVKSSLVTPAEGNPSWAISNLLDNRTYYWRIRAGDGQTYSEWASSSFDVQIINTAPSVPVVSNPGNLAWIEVLNPVLKVAPSVDLDGDQVTYEFQIFAQQDQQAPILVNSTILSQLQLPSLDNNQWYYWRVRALDSAGNLSGWSNQNQFFINLDGINDEPVFEFTAPVENAEIFDPLVNISWTDNDPDSSATIALFYNGENVIVEGLMEDDDAESDSYIWDVSSLAPGQYAISARIQDEDSVVNVVSCCVLTIPENPDHISVSSPVSLDLDEPGVAELEVEVVLNRAVSAGNSVVLNFSVSDDSEAVTINEQNYLIFDDSNWNIPQVITIKGNDDCLIDGDVPVSLVFAPAVSGDPVYAGILAESVNFVTQDNEYQGQELFVCDYTLQSQMQDNGEIYKTTLLPIISNLGVTNWQTVAGTVAPADNSLSLVLVDGTPASSLAVSFTDVWAGQQAEANGAIDMLAPLSQIAYGSEHPKLVWSLISGDAYASNLSTANDDVVDGDESNNFLQGLGGDDTLSGMGGDDILYGGSGSDLLYGGDGDDTFLTLGSDYGVDYFDGGDGFDQIIGGFDTDVVKMQSFAPSNSVELINLSNGKNRIEGTPGSDSLNFSLTTLLNILLIDGLAGDDIITGSAGSDVIKGGTGSDILNGDDGDDVFYFIGAAAGVDTIVGGSGVDTISAPSNLAQLVQLDENTNWTGETEIALSGLDVSSSIEVVEGGFSTTYLSGTDTDNVFKLSSFQHAIQLNNIAEIRLKDGNDTFVGSLGDDVVSGGPGDDVLYGMDGDDVFLFDGVGQGIDYVDGGQGIDTIRGASGDDVIELKAGSGSFEIIDGGGGYNILAGEPGANWIDLSQVMVTSIDLIDGRAGNDVLRGTTAPDTIKGGLGDDSLDGYDGDDLFLYATGDGVDYYVGGNGYDILMLTPADDVLELSYFYGAYTVEKIDGNGGLDIIVGTAESDTLRFRDTELIGIQYIDPKSGNDLVYGSDGADTIYCSEGSDELLGMGGDDIFICNPAIDGVDQFHGGSGYDVIRLTENDDTFVLNYFSGSYTVEEIDGGAGYNVINGTSTSNIIDLRYTTLVAIDHIDGKEGNDSIFGSPNADVIIGGAGDDALDGRGGNDVFLLEEGDTSCDRYVGSSGIDTIRGTSSDDIICISYYYGAYTVEHIDGVSGNDAIVGNQNGNTLYFDNTTFNNILQIAGGPGDDFIRGNGQDNTISGGTGDDQISGLNGDDTFVFAPGDGRDLLLETQGGTDKLRLIGISKDDVWLFRSGNSLFVYVLGSTDRVEFRDWFYAADAQVEIIELDSGEMLDVVGLQQLSDVMTPHGNPDDAGFSVSATDQATIDAEIQAAWN